MDEYFDSQDDGDIFFFTKKMTDEFISEATDFCLKEIENLTKGNECADSYMLAWDNKPKSLLETTLNTRDAVWCASGPERGLYAAIFNLGEEDSEVSISLEELEIYHPVNATELWSGRTGVFEDSINVSVPGHGAMVFLLE